jgi:cytochrome b pre-mRNA-processing protein 3
MIFQFFRRTRDDPSITSLYGTIVAQARAKALYQRFGVPDTVNGRLEMILLHVVLLLRRLNEEPDGASWGQAVFDLFCQDMDDNLREMGVGTSRCRRRCGASARRSMGGRLPIAGRWHPAISRHWSRC